MPLKFWKNKAPTPVATSQSSEVPKLGPYAPPDASKAGGLVGASQALGFPSLADTVDTIDQERQQKLQEQLVGVPSLADASKTVVDAPHPLVAGLGHGSNFTKATQANDAISLAKSGFTAANGVLDVVNIGSDVASGVSAGFGVLGIAENAWRGREARKLRNHFGDREKVAKDDKNKVAESIFKRGKKEQNWQWKRRLVRTGLSAVGTGATVAALASGPAAPIAGTVGTVASGIKGIDTGVNMYRKKKSAKARELDAQRLLFAEVAAGRESGKLLADKKEWQKKIDAIAPYLDLSSRNTGDTTEADMYQEEARLKYRKRNIAQRDPQQIDAQRLLFAEVAAGRKSAAPKSKEGITPKGSLIDKERWQKEIDAMVSSKKTGGTTEADMYRAQVALRKKTASK